MIGLGVHQDLAGIILQDHTAQFDHGDPQQFYHSQIVQPLNLICIGNLSPMDALPEQASDRQGTGHGIGIRVDGDQNMVPAVKELQKGLHPVPCAFYCTLSLSGISLVFL